jgi:hypothetical protein
LASCPTAKGIIVDGCPVLWSNCIFLLSFCPVFETIIFTSVNTYRQLVAAVLDNGFLDEKLCWRFHLIMQSNGLNSSRRSLSLELL